MPDSPLATARLDEVAQFVWTELDAGAASARHGFHTGEVATVAGDGPRVRTVVLRRVIAADRLLIFHTDRRSPKFGELRADPRVCWHFYDKSLKVQLRLRGRARVSTDDALADRQWAASRPASRACYRSARAPGASIGASGPGLVDGDGREHFAVVATRIEDIDWLLLRHQGHRRARLVAAGDGWRGDWIAP